MTPAWSNYTRVSVSNVSLALMRHPARLIRSVALLPLAFGVLLSTTACKKDRLKKLLGGDPRVDTKWGSDSSFLKSNAELLFTAFKTKNGIEVAPIGTIGPRGFRNVRLGDRGWRAFDIQYFRGEKTLEAYRAGASVGALPIKRGMWGDNQPALDSIPGCEVIVPSGLAAVPEGVHLLTIHKRPPIAPSLPVSEAEVAEALRQASMLVATKKGIPIGKLPLYKRTVHMVNSGYGTKPTIVAMFDDPEIYPDTLLPDWQRPRHLVVFMDWAIWGYKATWTYSTLGNKGAPPRFRYLDFIDVNDDGKPEVLFGVQNATDPLFTIVVRRDRPVWIEETRQRGRRCQS